ncbi:MAG: radical SAM protein, partial [Desulfatibacillaceae bacterium]|nr:radical SAM protein [Desulfatibacillaceae bacterium]
LLIQPLSDTDRINLLPHSLLALSAWLVDAGYRVKILDCRIERYCEKNLLEIAGRGLVLVGITFYTGSQIRHALKLASLLKNRYPAIPIVAGGPHATVTPEQTASHPDIDFVVRGEGEKSLLALARALEAGKDVSQIPRLCYKKDGKLVSTPDSSPISLKNLPDIPYQLIRPYRIVYDAASMDTSRGCTHKCGYCVIPLVHPKPRMMPPATVVLRLKALLQFKKSAVYFMDDNFFMSMGRVRRILDLMEQEGLSFNWWAMARIDDIGALDDAFIARLVEKGLSRLYLGAESGSEKVLLSTGKNLKLDDIINANRKLARFPIYCEYTFMAGLPGETEEDLNMTMALIEQLRKENPRAVIWKINDYMPYPGTRLFEEAVQAGFDPPQSLEQWADLTYYRRKHKGRFFQELE